MGGGTKEKPVSHWGPGAPRFRTKGFWKDAVKWNAAHEQWKNQPCDPKFRPAVDAHPNPRIFPSLCDWLDDEVPLGWLADFLKLIHDTPNLDWLLLTKRSDRFFRRLAGVMDIVGEAEGFPESGKYSAFGDWLVAWIQGRPPLNVWIGVSVEDQERADQRIPELLRIPAKVRFLSVEPLLGPVDLEDEWLSCKVGTNSGIHWAIVGGESGRGARPCNVGWVRSVVQQCKTAAVPCFVKQLGASVFFEDTNLNLLKHPKGGDPSEWPEDLRVREFPKL